MSKEPRAAYYAALRKADGEALTTRMRDYMRVRRAEHKALREWFVTHQAQLAECTQQKRDGTLSDANTQWLDANRDNIAQ